MTERLLHRLRVFEVLGEQGQPKEIAQIPDELANVALPGAPDGTVVMMNSARRNFLVYRRSDIRL